ncbi:MAG: ATP-binding protein [Pseudomonadota bacterium]
MNVKRAIAPQIEKNGLILIAFAMVAIYWVIDSLASGLLFPRTLIVTFVIIYGIFTQTLINSRKAALDDKEKTQQQLIQSESLAAIGQLVAGIAHELNNPLSSTASFIQSDIELINEQEDKREIDHEILADLEFSLKELNRAETIVKSVLGLSRQTQTYAENVNLNKILEDTLRILHNQYSSSDITIVKDFDNNLQDINGNFANLGQVFINIIQNALQALPDNKGFIYLTTRYNNNTNCIEIECRDTGEGIPSEDIKDIFKPFYTTKEVGKGSGLGLYISHEIIKKHGGLITVSSNKDKGTTFLVALPARGEKEDE